MERRRTPVAVQRVGLRRRRKRRLAVLLLLALTALASFGLAHSQGAARDGITSRWNARSALAAGFVDTYLSQLFASEQTAAERNLSVGTSGFATVVSTFGFSNALLLDGQGRVLAIYPAKPALIGKAIAGQYPHLTSAEAGRRAVSPVVKGAADGASVVGFALPFPTPTGPRVFSGAYAVRGTPLAAYLRNLTPLKGAHVYLVDDTGQVLTSSASTPRVGTLASVDPDLAKAYARKASGAYGDSYFSSHRVTGAPWTVVASTPNAALLASVRGPSHYAPWGLLAVLTLTAGVVIWLVSRRADDHEQLRRAYERLDRLASLDSLTGLLNRRSTHERLDREHDQSRRHGTWTTVLMIDVDHFKRINDTFGHAAGDVALIAVADRLRLALRETDAIGRWGGEEFLVVLPETDPETAGQVAERLRATVAHDPVEIGTGGDLISVSVSIGACSSRDAIPEVLVASADRALYLAKAAGRDRVHAHTS